MTMVRPHLFAVILAGGSGTRFWPASRRLRPKQLLPLVPGLATSLLAQTVDRIRPLVAPENILIATGRHLLDATKAALPDLPATSFLGEPQARNTAPCIGWASAEALRRDPQAVVMVLPSDHHIGMPDAFRDSLARAVDAAADGTITTVGITPTRPETGYGYIEMAEEKSPGIHAVKRFVEKPNTATAQQYLAAGTFLWNSGMFFFSAKAMREAITAHLPALDQALNAWQQTVAAEPDAAADALFAAAPSISIDYGIMEKVPALNVVPAQFGWSDLGSWQAMHELADADSAGNVGPEGSLFLDASGNLIADLRTTRAAMPTCHALLGVNGLCLVLTDDATLVLPIERSQDVRDIVDRLKREERTALL